MLRNLLALAALLAIATAVVPVAHLNATAYFGRWYQIIGNAASQDTYELGATCVTADYGLISEHNVSGEFLIMMIIRPRTVAAAASLIRCHYIFLQLDHPEV